MEYNRFNNIINDRDIVYVPIISCINRQTGEYDLSCDGNVNRFITTFSYCNNFNHLHIILPSKHVNNSEYLVEKWISKSNNITIHYCSYFGIHAGEQRNNDDVVQNMYLYVRENFDLTNKLFIFESQKLAKLFLSVSHDVIFYNPVSKTNKTRIFLEGYDEINDYLVDKCLYTIVCGPDQVDYYKDYKDKIIYLDKLIDRDLDIFSKYNKDKEFDNRLNQIDGDVYYLPFRLTDEGYQFNKVVNFIKNSSKCNYFILYSDPNNSKILDTFNFDDEFKSKFIKVSTERDLYYTIIDSKKQVIIPYFEDLDFINHAAIHEFINDKANCIICVDSKLNNPYNINNCNRIKHIKLNCYE
jgi:hypothetical protein